MTKSDPIHITIDYNPSIYGYIWTAHCEIGKKKYSHQGDEKHELWVCYDCLFVSIRCKIADEDKYRKEQGRKP